MNYAVYVKQEIGYGHEITAVFATFDEATIFINTILTSCVNANCTISKIKEGSEEE